MENKKITFEELCDPEYRRREQFKVKSEAVWATFIELNGMINVSKFSKLYLNKTHSWFAQRLHGYMVGGKPMVFKEEEYSKIAESLRDLGKKLNEYADKIDAAKLNNS